MLAQDSFLSAFVKKLWWLSRASGCLFIICLVNVCCYLSNLPEFYLINILVMCNYFYRKTVKGCINIRRDFCDNRITRLHCHWLHYMGIKRSKSAVTLRRVGGTSGKCFETFLRNMFKPLSDEMIGDGKRDVRRWGMGWRGGEGGGEGRERWGRRWEMGWRGGGGGGEVGKEVGRDGRGGGGTEEVGKGQEGRGRR